MAKYGKTKNEIYNYYKVTVNKTVFVNDLSKV